jgi:hypothetical protein
VATFLGTLAAVVFALLLPFSATLGAGPQEPTSVSSFSLERIRQELEKPPTQPLNLDGHLHLPVATFKTSVESRRFTLTLEEELHKKFELNLLQRQSRDWASRCCGYNLNQLATSVKKALQRRKARQIRQQVEQELAEVVKAAARK